MQTDWIDMLDKNSTLHDLVRQSEDRQAQQIDGQADLASKGSHRLWDEVKRRRKAGENTVQTKPRFNGPPML